MIARKQLFYPILLLCLVAGSLGAVAQEEAKPLPIDSLVRYGKLPNGLTYYIRHNEVPKGRADFGIAQRVGSLMEEDNERGLAHLLEHMAFAGTTHFPGREMEHFLERAGIGGGEGFNAYTAFDETVYNIANAPTARPGVVDSCLLILRDWAGGITLADSAIERERSIVREEWRTRQDAQSRLWEQQLPHLYPGSRYANRLPIGTLDVINTFTPNDLRAYYKRWYRPDLQAIIVVGDINPNQVEATLTQLFTNLSAPHNPAPREHYGVPDNDMPLISIAKDREETLFKLNLFYKHEKLPQELYASVTGLVKDYFQIVCALMINERLSALTYQGVPPFLDVQAYDGDYLIARTHEAWTASAVAKEEGIDSTLTLLVKETERVRLYGFTPHEYDRARLHVLKQYEMAYNQRSHQENSHYTDEYVRHFTQGGYIPGIAAEYELLNQIAPTVSVEQVNRYIQDMLDGDRNVVISLSGPDKAGFVYPTEEELLRTFLKAKHLPVEPFSEEVSNEPLIPQLPPPGKIVTTEHNQPLGATLMTLSNGVRVVLKPSQSRADEILMTALRPGGSSLFPDRESANIKVFNQVVGLGGWGTLSATDLNKRLVGCEVSCTPWLTPENQTLTGSAIEVDLRTLFELIYLTFTAPRVDEAAFLSYESRLKAQVQNRDLDPNEAFGDSLTHAAYNNPRAMPLQLADFDHISYPRIQEMYRDRFTDATGSLFVFVGNVDTVAIRPLLEQYLATLPANGQAIATDTLKVPAMRKGIYRSHFRRPMEVPKASVASIYSGRVDYTLEHLICASMLEQILNLVYMERVRLDEGGSYDVQASLYLWPVPEGEISLHIGFDTDPAKRVHLSTIVQNELNRLVNSGVRPDDFAKSREILLKRHAESVEQNQYWLTTLCDYYYKGFDSFSYYTSLLQSLTPQRVQEFARQILSQGNQVEVIMEP